MTVEFNRSVYTTVLIDRIREEDDPDCQLTDGPRPGSLIRACESFSFYYYPDETGDTVSYVYVGLSSQSTLRSSVDDMGRVADALARELHG